MLTLPIKKKWFDMIVSGEKKEEYREIKPYYDSRFMNALGFLRGNSNARIYRIRWRFCYLYVSYSSIFIPIQHFSRLI